MSDAINRRIESWLHDQSLVAAEACLIRLLEITKTTFRRGAAALINNSTTRKFRTGSQIGGSGSLPQSFQLIAFDPHLYVPTAAPI